MLFTALLAAHVILARAGYAGLIATNVWLLALCSSREAATVRDAVITWRNTARIFGPILGAGMLVGFGLAPVSGTPLSAHWLIAAYALVFLALGAQAAIMVPWQLRAEGALARGEALARGPIVTVIAAFTLAYVAIASLMVIRPS